MTSTLQSGQTYRVEMFYHGPGYLPRQLFFVDEVKPAPGATYEDVKESVVQRAAAKVCLNPQKVVVDDLRFI